MALFNQSYEELREAFVRGRFGEKLAFGTEDVVQKLIEQSVADQPDLDFWHGCVVQLSNQISAGLTAEILQMHGAATIAHHDFSVWMENLTQSKRSELWRFMMENGAKIYMTTNGFPVMVITTRGGAMAYFPREDGTPDWPNEPILIDALLWGWKNHNNTNARDFLCDRLDTAIKTERRAAENDFDKAVAVSEDGKKIVCTDGVVVFDGETITRFPAKAFLASKICLEPEKYLHDTEVRCDYRDRKTFYKFRVERGGKKIEWIRFEDSHHQAIDRNKTNGDTYLYTHRQHCPSPLPLGGEVIKLS